MSDDKQTESNADVEAHRQTETGQTEFGQTEVGQTEDEPDVEGHRLQTETGQTELGQTETGQTEV